MQAVSRWGLTRIISGLVERSGDTYRILKGYHNKNQEIIDSIGLDNLKRVHALFDKNSNINRSMLTELFGDALTLKQVRGLLSKMEQFGLILHSGDGKNTQYSQAGKFKRLFMMAEK